jgi:glycosyltransferase involved in cell wall biosynthesis
MGSPEHDGSADATRDVFGALLVADDQRLVLIRNERNLGLISSLNWGLEHARG